MNNFFVIIVHYGSVAVTVDCLKSIYDKANLPVIVIDNSCNPALAKELKVFPGCRLHTPPRNLGFAGANNMGMKLALEKGAEYIFLLNNDTLVPEGFFEKIMGFAGDSDAGIISPKIYFAPGFEFHRERYSKKDLGKVIWYAGGLIDWKNCYASHRGVDEVDRGQYGSVSETAFATGCAMLVKKDVIDRIGFISEDYFLYYEDVDFSLTAKGAGIKVVYYPDAVIFHKNAGSSKGPGSNLHQYYQTRNRLHFGYKFAKFRVKTALFRESLRFFVGGGIRRRAVVDFYLQKKGKTKI